MREEAKLWIKQALKSLYIHKLSRFPGTTHSLLYLGRSVGVAKEFEGILRKLTPDFVITRYHVSQEAPYELYDILQRTE